MARLVRLLSIRATRVFILILLIIFCFIYRPVRVDLKAAPTDFSSLPDIPDWPSYARLPRPLVRKLHGSSGLDIGGRYLFIRKLGGGREGSVRLYGDTSTGGLVAIKRFQSVYRNPVPAPILEALKAEDVIYWPAEIQATILLGGLTLGTDASGFLSKRGLGPSSLDMLPALDYFLVRGSTWTSPSLTWHLATPYLGKGTLTDLAKSLKAESRTSSDLDHSLRPSLQRLLLSIERIHRTGIVSKARCA